MRTEFEKYMHITSELLSYCHRQGAKEFHLNLNEKEDATSFTITASPANVNDVDMEQLLKKLQVPRRREMEQNFWELSGGSEDTSELLLIGMMVDDVSVVQENGAITINLTRMN